MTDHYPLFVHWYETLNWILTTAEQFPKQARFSFASRLIDAALDTLDLIVEAIYTKERLHILDRLNLYIEKQRIFFRLACDRRYISPKQQAYIADALNRAGQMIGGWRKDTLEKIRLSAGADHSV